MRNLLSRLGMLSARTYVGGGFSQAKLRRRVFGWAGRCLVVMATLGALIQPAAQAANLYWDTDGTTSAGFSAVTGTWDGVNAFWNPDSTGGNGAGAEVAITSSADDLFLTAGTAGTITISGTQSASSLTLSNNVANTITGGTLQVGGTGAANGLFVTSAVTAATAFSSALSLNAPSTIQNAGTGALTVSGGITGTGNLTLLNDGATASGITISAGSVDHNGTLTNAGTGAGSVAISSVIGTNVTEVIQNSATSQFVLTGLNTFTGPVTISAGTLNANTIADTVGSALGLGTQINFGGGTLVYSGNTTSTVRSLNMTGSGTINVSTAGQTLTITGGVNGTGGQLLLRGAGNVQIDGLIATGANSIAKTDGGTLTLTNVNNSFTGQLTINNGVTIVSSIADSGVNSAAGAGSVIQLGQTGFSNTGTLRLNNVAGGSTNRTINIQSNSATTGGVLDSFVAGQNFILTGAIDTTNLSATGGLLTLTGAGDGRIDGVLADKTTGSANLAVTKSGAGTWVLNNAMTYTGLTTITTGTLKLGSAGSLAAGVNLTTASTTTFDINGQSPVLGLVTNGGTVTNSGAAANLTVGNGTTGAGAWSGAMSLTVNAGATNSALSGAFTNTGNIVLNANGAGIITLSGSTNPTGSITNSGSGAAMNTISGVIGTNVTGIVQNSATSILELTNGTNTFSTGVIIKQGSLRSSQNTASQFASLGTGTVTLGDTGGSNAATLLLQGTAATWGNAVTLGSTSGTLTIRGLNGSTAIAFNGAITGTNNITLDSNANTAAVTFASVNNAGVINGLGTGSGALTITTVGANVTGINHAGTSGMVVTNANVAGVLNVGGSSLLTVTTVGASVTGVNHTGAGALTITNALPITAGTTISNAGTGLYTLTGGVGAGAGNLIFNTTTTGGITSGAIATTGTITNSGSGTGTTTISGVIGTTTSSITQDSATSALTLSGTNTFTGPINVNRGTLNVGASGLGAAAATANLTLGTATTLGIVNSTATGSSARNVVVDAGGGEIDSASGTLTLTGTITYGSNPLTFGGAGTVLVGSATSTTRLSGSGAINKNGAGTLTLSNLGGNAAISGAVPINVNAGTLSVASTNVTTANILGTGLITITPGATVTIGQTGSNTNTYGNNLAIANATGTATFTSTSGAVPFTGTVSFLAGANTPTFQIRNTNGTAGTMTFSGAISGTGNLQTNPTAGGSTINITGAQNQTGTITNVGASTSTVTLSGAIGSGISLISQGGANPFTVSSQIPVSATLASLTSTGTGLFTISGGTTSVGSQALALSANSTGAITVSTNPINHTGTFTNSGTGNNIVTVSTGIGANLTNIVQNGAASQLLLTGTNTYTGTTTATSGLLNFVSTLGIPDFATSPATAFGKMTATTGGIISLPFGGASNTTTNTDIANLLNGTYNVFQNGSSLGLDTTNASPTTAVLTTVITNPSGVTSMGFAKTGTNSLTIPTNNTYTGPTAIYNGTLNVSSLNRVVGGTASSSLGAPISAANGIIQLGGATTSGALVHSGAGEITDRVINLGGSTGGGTIDFSGTGLLKFTSNMTINPGAKTLTLTGTGTGEFGGTIPGTISTGTTPLTLTKSGAGSWALTGAGNIVTRLNVAGTLDIGAGGITISNAGSTTLQGTADAVINATGGGTITLGTNTATDGPDSGAANGTTLTINAVIAGTSPYENFVVANGTGVTVLTADNTFTGDMIINSSVVSVGKIGNTGVAGNIGAGTNIRIANALSTLRYTGTGESNNRVIILAGTTTGGIIEQAGTGNLRFTANFGGQGAGAKVLTLTGSTAGTGEIAGIINENSTTNTTGVTKTGTGTWTLSGANTYTGATTVNGGNLVLAGSLSNTAITVGSAGTFSPQAGKAAGSTAAGTAGATLTLNGGTLNLADGTVGNFTLNGQATFAGTGATFNGGTLRFDMGTTLGANDAILVNLGGVAATGKATSSITSGLNAIFINPIGASLATGTYDLIRAGTGSTLNASHFYLPATSMNIGGTNYNFALALSGNTEQLIVSTGAATAPNSAFWTGLTNSSWSTVNGGTGTTNWAATASGTPNTFAVPGAPTNVTMSANTVGAGGLSTTLDGAITINSLTFSGTGTANTAGATVAAGAGGSLTINALALSGNTLGNGINVLAGSGANTISANVALGGNQTWTNASTNALTVSGIISDGGSNYSLTKAGTGALVLSNTNTYGGGTTISAGTLTFSNGSLGTTGNITLGGGTLQWAAGNTQDISVGRTVGFTGTASFDTNGNDVTLSNAIGNAGAFGLTKLGVGTLTLSGTNTYTGINTISAGVLSVATSANLGTNATATAITFASGGTGTLRLANGFTTVTGQGITQTGPAIYEVNGTDTATIATAIAGAGTLSKTGSGTLSLGVVNTFTGAINVSGGLLSYTGSGAAGDPTFLGSGAKTVTLTNGGGIQVITALSNPSSGSKSFVMGTGGGVLSVLSGAGLQLDDANQFSGAGDLTVQGAGTGFVYLHNQAFNFTGNAFVNSGTLRLGANAVLGTTAGRSVTVASGGTLEFNNTAINLPLSINLNGGSLNSIFTGVTLSSAINLVSDSFVGGANTLILNGAISGAGGLTKSGASTVTLGGASTFTGPVTIGSGSLSVATLNSVVGGVATSTLGAPTTVSGGTISLGSATAAGTLLINAGNTGETTDRVVNLAGTTFGGTIDQSGTGTLRFTSDFTASGAGTKILTLQGSTAGIGRIDGAIVDNSIANLTNVTKAGTGTWILDGASSYTGVTTVTAGTLQVSNLQNGGTNSNIGAASNAATNLVLGTATLAYSGTGSQTTDRAFTINAGATATINVSQPLANLSMPGATGAATTGVLTKTGVGRLTLTGASTNTGNTNVNGGTLVFDGATASMATTKLLVGFGATNSGAVIQKAGTTIAINTALSGQDVLSLGGTGGYGYYSNSGTLTTGQLALGGNSAGANTTGVFEQRGGSTTVSNASGWIVFGWAGSNPNGIINIFDGTITNNSTTNDTTMGFSASQGSMGMINLLGAGAALNTTAGGTSRTLNLAANTGNFGGYLNLNGGVLTANSVRAANATTPTYFGFNGGTLKANSAITTFVTGITATTLYSGGATIDSNGFNVTIPQALLAPTGSGLATIPVLDGGAGYIGAPAVRITGGGGTGASAIANVELDPLSANFGKVTSFTITSAGSGYTSAPTISLIGGGATTAAIPDVVTLSTTATTGGLTKIGTGVLTLSGVNTYGGVTTINGGSVSVASLPTGAATSSPLGAVDASAANLVLNGGSLQYTGAAAATDHLFTLGALGGGLDASGASNAAVTFSNTGAVAFTGTGTRTLTLTGASTGANTFAPLLGNEGANATSLVKSGAGTWVLTNANTYAGSTQVQGGTLSVSSINSVVGGVATSSLGAPTTALAGTIAIGSAATAGTLIYTGLGETSDRVIDLAGTTGGVTIDASGTGALVLSSAMTASGVGAKTLTLTGTNTGNNTIGGAIVDNSVGNITSLSKTGAGTWVLSGTSNYTGATTVTGGTLNVTGSIAGTSAVTISGGTSTIVRATTPGGLGSGTLMSATGSTTPIIQLHMDGAGSNGVIANATRFSSNSGTNPTFDVNNNGSANTGNLIQLNGANADIGTGTITVTGGNGYGLFLPNVRTTAGSVGTQTFNPTTAYLVLGSLTSGPSHTTGTDINVLDGTNANNAITGAIASGGGTNVVNIVKSNTSTWTLSGVNTYTGSTTVNGGTLRISGGSMANTPITVNPGTSGPVRTLAVTPGTGTINLGDALTAGAGGTLTLNAGSAANPIGTTFTMVDNAVGTVNLVQEGTFAGNALTIGGASAVGYVAPTLSFDIGGTALTDIDKLVVSTLVSVGTGGGVINFSPVSTATSLMTGDYTFLTATGGLGSNLTLGTAALTVGGINYQLSLTNSTTTSAIVTVTELTGNTQSFWTNSQADNSWKTINGSNTNFATNALGTTNTGALPDSGSNVTFTANTATGTLSTSLDQNFTINSLNFTGTGTPNTAGTTIASGTGSNTLTINALALNGNILGNGISVAAGSGNNLISAKVALGGSQTWTVNGSALLTVSGDISEASAGPALTKAGTGTLLLSGNNSHTGGTTLTGGTLLINSPTALGTGTLTLASGTIDTTATFAGQTLTTNNAQTWISGATVNFTGSNALNMGTGAVSLGIDSSTGSFTISNNATIPLNTLTIGGTITSAAGGTAGAKTLTIAGTGNTILAGNISKGAASSLALTSTATGTLTLGGAVNAVTSLNLNGGATSVIDIGSGNLTISNGGGNTIQSTTGGVINGTGTITIASASATDGGNNGPANGMTLTINPKITGTNPYESFVATNGTGVTVLANDTNDFTGNLLINSGTVAVATIANQNLASAAGAGTTILFGANNTTTLRYTGTGATTDRIINLAGTTTGGTIEQAGTGLLKFTTDLSPTGAGSKALTLSGSTAGTGEISGIISDNSATNKTGVTKSGTGAWTLSAINTYSGATTVSAGTLNLTGTIGGGLTGSAISVNGGTLLQSAAGTITNSSSLAVTAGGLATLAGTNNYTGSTTLDLGTLTVTGSLSSGPLVFGAANGSANVSTLDLSAASATFAGLTARTNNASSNTITVGAGRTLAINGDVTLGYNAGSGTGATLSRVAVSGAGSMTITGTTVNIGTNQSATNAAYWNDSTLDVTGISSFSMDVTTFNIGVGGTTQGPGSVLLSNTANTIIATTLDMGDTGSNNGRGTGLLQLGTGTNVICADTIYIGRGKGTGPGLMNFASQAAGSPGTVTITDKAGNGAANITVANINGVGTSGGSIGSLDLRGHVSNVTAATLTIANNNGSSDGNVTGNVYFDAGTFTVNTLNMAAKSSSNTGNATAVLEVGGGSFTVNTGGTFTLGSQATAGTAIATLNILGGTFTSNASIVEGGGSVTSTLTLNGGTLDMTGQNIGSTTVLNNVNLRSGTLKNVGQHNNGAALVKTTVGLLNMTGTSSYTGQTQVQAGTLTFDTIANVSGGASSLGAPTTVANGTIAVGSTVNDATLQYLGAATVSTNRVVDLTGTTGGATIDSSGAGAITFASSLTVTGAGSKTLTLAGTSTGANVIGGVIPNNSGVNITSLAKTGAGLWILAGANTYTGTTTIGGGTLQVGNGGTTGVLGGGAVTNNAALAFNRTDTVTVANAITGTGSLTQAGAGTTILTGANAYGATTISAGTLQVGNAGTTGTLGTGTITNNSALVFNRSDSINVSSAINGTGSVAQSGAGTTQLSGVNGYTGATTVNTGTLQVDGSVAASSGVTVAGSATFTAGTTQVVKSLNLSAASSNATILAGAIRVLSVGDNTTASPLTLTGGKMDLNTSALIVDFTAGNEAANLTLVKNAIIAGRNAGAWNGTTGITSSAAAAASSVYGVGYAPGTVATAAIAGVTPDASSMVARYTRLGDANLDGAVNFFDLTALAAAYGAAGEWYNGDFDYSGDVNFFDLTALAANYGTGLPSEPIPGATPDFSADLAAAFASVPEPGAISLLGLAALALLKRRNNRKAA